MNARDFYAFANGLTGKDKFCLSHRLDLHRACCIFFQGQTFLLGLLQFIANNRNIKEPSGVFGLQPCLVCFCGKKKTPSSVCQLGFRMDDLVASPLSVIIPTTESHKKCCWSHRTMHPDTHLQGFIKCCKHSQSYTSNNRMSHKKSLGQQYKCMCVERAVDCVQAGQVLHISCD